MSESHGPNEQHSPSFAAYMVVFAALSIFTAISFVVNHFFPAAAPHRRDDHHGRGRRSRRSWSA